MHPSDVLALLSGSEVWAHLFAQHSSLWHRGWNFISGGVGYPGNPGTNGATGITGAIGTPANTASPTHV